MPKVKQNKVVVGGNNESNKLLKPKRKYVKKSQKDLTPNDLTPDTRQRRTWSETETETILDYLEDTIKKGYGIEVNTLVAYAVKSVLKTNTKPK